MSDRINSSKFCPLLGVLLLSKQGEGKPDITTIDCTNKCAWSRIINNKEVCCRFLEALENMGTELSLLTDSVGTIRVRIQE